MNTFKIYPLVTLITDGNEMSMKTRGMNFGKTTRDPVIMWLVQGNGRNILVDSGQCTAEIATKNHHPSIQTEDMLPANLLRKRGVEPSQVDTVVLTHLHWDHCYNLELFPNATVYVQRRELEYAENPMPWDLVGYESEKAGFVNPWKPFRSRMTVMDGDFVLCDGITVYFLPGHSPGMQCPAVNTEKGVYLIASDNIPIKMNWDGDGKHQKHIPSAHHVNLADYYRSFERMEKICDVVLPAHDITLVEEHTVFPPEEKR